MKFICSICEKNFSSYNKKRRTCSRKCCAINQSKTVVKKCTFCKKEIKRRKSGFKSKSSFCNTECLHNWEKISKVKIPQLRDKNWCLRQYKKYSLKKIANRLDCGETTVYKFFKIHGIKLDRKKWLRGEMHYLWKGGITQLARAIRTCSYNIKWKKAVFERDLNVCKNCGSKENLEVDHIKKFKFILIDNKIKTLDDARKCKELWDVNNGRILCSRCNKVDCNLNHKSYLQ